MQITKLRVLGGIWNNKVDTALANVFGNHKADPNPVNRTPYSYGGINNLLNRINLSFIVAGLAGGLTTTDLSTIFIVNDKVYNIYDIIKRSQINNIIGGVTETDLAKTTKWNIWKYTTEKQRKSASQDPVKNRAAAITRSNNFYWDVMQGRKSFLISLKLNMKI